MSDKHPYINNVNIQSFVHESLQHFRVFYSKWHRQINMKYTHQNPFASNIHECVVTYFLQKKDNCLCIDKILCE